jgi:hypothetical protein
MRNRLVSLAAGLLLAVTAGCAGDPFDINAADTLATIKEFSDVLSTVKDRATAEAAKSRLEAAVDKMHSLQKRRQALGKATPEQDAAIRQKYGMEFDMQSRRMFDQRRRVAMDKEASEVLQDVMKKLEEAKAAR